MVQASPWVLHNVFFENNESLADYTQTRAHR